MSVHIDVNNNPTEEDRLAILEPLKRFNAEQAGDGKSEKVAMFIRDDQTRKFSVACTHAFFINGCSSSCWWCRSKPGARHGLAFDADG